MIADLYKKLVYEYNSKPVLLILALSILGVSFLVNIFLSAYLFPIYYYDIDINTGMLSYTKLSLYRGEIRLYKDCMLVQEKNVNSIWGKTNLRVEGDGKYKVEYLVGKSISLSEFVLQDNLPALSIDLPELTMDQVIKANFRSDELVSLYTSVNGSEKKLELSTVAQGNLIFVLDPGINQVVLYIQDSTGNIVEKNFEVQVDNMPPIIEVISPIDPIVYEEDISARFKISDNTSLDEVRINNQSKLPDSNGEYVFDTTLSEGINNIGVFALDTAGNKVEESFTIEKKTKAYGSSSSIKLYSSPGCAETLNGSNINCFNNALRKNCGLNALAWNSYYGNHAYWLAYCLDINNFSGDPHKPNEAVSNCIDKKHPGFILSPGIAEVTGGGFSTASGVVNAWADSTSHSQYTLSSRATQLGAGAYGKWSIAYVRLY